MSDLVTIIICVWLGLCAGWFLCSACKLRRRRDWSTPGAITSYQAMETLRRAERKQPAP